MDIEQIIHQAFTGTEPPPGALFSTNDAEGAEAVFGNARWEKLTAEELRLHSAAITFLSPPGFSYFLPAFMLAALTEHGIASSLEYRLAPPKNDLTRPSYAAWWRLLSTPQQEAVVAFVEHCQARDDTF